MTGQIGRPKKVRGMSLESLDLIEAMAKIAEAAQPITGRGVGYKLFTAGLIPSMATPDMKRDRSATAWKAAPDRNARTATVRRTRFIGTVHVVITGESVVDWLPSLGVRCGANSI